MNHLTNNFDELNNEFLHENIEDETLCFFCLHPVEAEDIKELRVIGKNALPTNDIVKCCEDCYTFQTSNK